MQGTGGVFDDLRDAEGPGFAVAIIRDGEVLHQECFGLASLEHRLPISERTRFHIVSCSKTFTAAAVLLLAARGLLDLEDCISQHLPELPGALFAEGPIRIRHLLAMTSGLRDGLEMLRLQGVWHPSEGRVGDIMALARANPTTQFRAGSRYVYTNTNYVTLEAIIERVSGRPADDFRAREIYRPLALGDTGGRYHDGVAMVDLASPYVPDGAGGYHGATHLLGIAGDPIVSSLRDLTTWLQTWRGGRIGAVEVFGEMTAGRRATGEAESYYGLGMALRAYRGQPVWCHSGSQPGYKTHLAYLPDLDLGIVILANRNDARPAARLPALVDALAAPARLGPRAADSADGAASAYPADGVYFDDIGHELVWLTRSEGRLEGETLGDPFTLYPGPDGIFRDRDDYLAHFPVTLRPDPETAGSCEISLAGYAARYRRLPPFGSDPEAAADLLGVYEGPSFGALLTVDLDGAGEAAVTYGAGFDRAMRFRMQALAPDLYLVRPTAPGIAFKHLFAFRRGAGGVDGVEVTMERLKQQWLRRRA